MEAAKENRISQLHREAMNLSCKAMMLKLQGDRESAIPFQESAFEKEKEAALLLFDEFELEPSRSVLFRSAASLAMECMRIQEAERMVAMGLAGRPPEEIADELRDLLEQIHFARKLSSKGEEHKNCEPLDKNNEIIELRGVLRFADSIEKSGKIKIVDEENNVRAVKIPLSLVGDIVRSLFDENILIRCEQQTDPQGKTRLIRILCKRSKISINQETAPCPGRRKKPTVSMSS